MRITWCGMLASKQGEQTALVGGKHGTGSQSLGKVRRAFTQGPAKDTEKTKRDLRSRRRTGDRCILETRQERISIWRTIHRGQRISRTQGRWRTEKQDIDTSNKYILAWRYCHKSLLLVCKNYHPSSSINITLKILPLIK